MGKLTLADAQAHAAKHGYELKELAGAPDRTDTTHSVSSVSPPRKVREPNKTEAEYGRILEAMRRRDEVVEYRYEGITLRWADMRYTPDWFVVMQERDLTIKLIEVKGGHIWDRDIVRFKGCRAEWGHHFQFEMWQKKGGEWRRIL